MRSRQVGNRFEKGKIELTSGNFGSGSTNNDDMVVQGETLFCARARARGNIIKGNCWLVLMALAALLTAETAAFVCGGARLQRIGNLAGLRRASSFAKGKRKSALGCAAPSPSSSSGEKFYVSTPIYYVNGAPHIGHAYTSLAADVLVRYARLGGSGMPFLLTGVDEHGEKVAGNAESQSLHPQDLCNANSARFEALLETLGISNDYYIRTTSDLHKAGAQQFWKDLQDSGHIYKGSYEGWYSVTDECYYADSELQTIEGTDEKVAPTGSKVVWKEKEETYFFKLSAFEQPLLDHIRANPDFILPASRRNEVLSFLESGLRDLSISRTKFKWGIPVPNDPDHVMYVWIDALTNYLTALGYKTSPSKLDALWPPDVQVVGKDILRFHAVYWPAMLMAVGMQLPKRIYAHGWWTRDGEKISKSLGELRFRASP